jgi:hypothetical protein
VRFSTTQRSTSTSVLAAPTFGEEAIEQTCGRSALLQPRRRRCGRPTKQRHDLVDLAEVGNASRREPTRQSRKPRPQLASVIEPKTAPNADILTTPRASI